MVLWRWVDTQQLDKGAGRQIGKCLDLLNCVAPAAFRKHSTWVQLWHLGANLDLAFQGGGLHLTEPLSSVIYGIIGFDQLLLKSAWLVNLQPQKRAVLYVPSIVLLGLLFVKTSGLTRDM